MELPFLRDIVIIFGLSVSVLLICSRLAIPAIVGFLITGIISGPHSLALVHGIDHVETLAKIGIMFLLFAIGLEFSLKRLLEFKQFLFIGGTLQVFLTTLSGIIIAHFLERPIGEAILIGFLLAMSSTAIVAKSLGDKTDSLYGRLSIGILIYQDIIAVPMMLLIPVLCENPSSINIGFFSNLIIGLGIICIVFLTTIKIVPKILFYVAKVRSRELFSLCILFICFSVAWIASSLGLSLAIGAFLAGLIISESEYNQEVIGNIVPLQDILSSFFFVSIGMTLDLEFVWQQPFLILFIALGAILLKSIIGAFTAFCLGLPLRTMILSGIALSQIGEFSFILSHAGLSCGLGSPHMYQLFIAVTILTMGLTPALMSFAPRIADLLEKIPLPNVLKIGFNPPKITCEHILHNHIIIIGFGVAGRTLAHALKSIDLPYIIVETNPKTVRIEKQKGEPICFGDATHESVLHYLNIANASNVAVMINDRIATERIVTLARKLNPLVYLIVRTRYISDIQTINKLGASEVISDEFGSSLEILIRVLQKFQIPSEKIQSILLSIKLNFTKAPNNDSS